MNDFTELSKKLGILHREVWQYHDQEMFEQLATSAQALLVNLYFDPKWAKKAAEHIKHAFTYADKATDAMKVSDTILERRMYEEAAAHLKQARTLLQLEAEGGIYEVKWWYAFRHRDGAEVGRILFEELYLNTKDPEFSLLGAYFLFAAGKYHSKRDWMKVESLLQQYWQHVLERKYCFIAGGL